MKNTKKNLMKFQVTFLFQADMRDEDTGKPDSPGSALSIIKNCMEDDLPEFLIGQSTTPSEFARYKKTGKRPATSDRLLKVKVEIIKPK